MNRPRPVLGIIVLVGVVLLFVSLIRDVGKSASWRAGHSYGEAQRDKGKIAYCMDEAVRRYGTPFSSGKGRTWEFYNGCIKVK